ncbi:nitrite reductase small subunit NirD [Actinokineospora guangxiensis]|uniref:Nitrite reductase small subunit NirD n=1 Tax=Actinokineospora guangxiensis TaxID=1490288 RepID=A0ABW0EIU7_9PSEU
MTRTAPAWTPVCPVAAIAPETGVAVLLEGGEQVAVFRSADDTLRAIGNIDPFSGAAVLARGIVGDLGGVAVVASPMHKQRFDLSTGVCVDDPAVAVPTYPVRVRGATIEVGRP